MSYDYDDLPSPLVVDIETVPHEAAQNFVPAPDLSQIAAAKNLKDPAKIAADLEARQAAALAEHEGRLSRAALDWNLSRIVAIAWSFDAGASVVCRLCRTEEEERTALQEFWQRSARRPLIGFAARTFDAPTLIQRSRLLGIVPRGLSLARYGKGSIIDVRDVLTFDDARYEAVMPRSLHAFCRRFGIPVDDTIRGAEIPALVAAGDWAGVETHVTSDVRLTAALAVRIGLLQPQHEDVVL